MPSGPKHGLAARLGPPAVAVFVTLHLLAVLISVVPYPTHSLSAMKKVHDAREEVDRVLHAAHDLAGRPGSFRSFKRATLGLVDRYTGGVKRARHVVGPYLSTIGSSQRWNMFGGVPPRHPIIAKLDVAECGQKKKKRFVVWLDGHAGAPGDAAFDFRQRKAQESLFLKPKRARRAYARYWMNRWEREHPGRRLRALRFGYLETTTPPAAALGKKGARDKRLGSVTVSDKRRCRR
jgi:hypothetical protein